MSLLIATFASYVALDLAQRVRTRDVALARAWWAGGSVAMGTGIWSMHFVGMQAADFSFRVVFDYALTFWSWVAAVAASGVALYIASRSRLSIRRLLSGALAMGGGICTMHYMGMAAMQVVPDIEWSPGWVVVSAGVAIGASATALIVVFGLRRLTEGTARGAQAMASLMLGAGIGGMHYSGMAAANFPLGSTCFDPAGGLQGDQMGVIVAVATIGLLVIITFTSSIDARMQAKAATLASSLQQANGELQRLAFSDGLTGLPNRHDFETRLSATAERCARDHDTFFVLLLDLDEFKQVNDAFGTGFGDEVLCRIAARISRAVRAVDTVARLGSDEFVVLVEGRAEAELAGRVAQRIVDAVSERIVGADFETRVSCSIGIARFPADGPADRLMTHAGSAMRAAKQAGRGCHVFFTSQLDDSVREQTALRNDLRESIEKRELELHYQPKVLADGRTVTGVEALARWRHASRGMVSPAVFIPMAERFGLISALGHWVVEKACLQIARWEAQGLSMRVAVNVSLHQLKQEGLVEHIALMLERHGVAPSRLILEITESAAMEDVERTQRLFERLAALGVGSSIDDFGTGYSSLSHLRKLRVRQLKIDRSFVCDLEGSMDARVIVKAVIDLAHALHVDVVAEGVETAAQCDVLTAMECDELQGYFYSRPLAADAVRAWMLEFTQSGGTSARDRAPTGMSSLPV